MTPKQRVLKAWPTAYLFKWPTGRFGFSVKCASYPGQILAGASTASAAWQRAADRIAPPSTTVRQK